MTEIEKTMIMNLSLQKITNDKFMEDFDLKKKNVRDYILDNLNEGYLNKDEEEIEYSLLMYFSLNLIIFDKSNTKLLGKLLIEKWHSSHEDIAIIMQKIKDPSSITFLVKAMCLNLDYLNYNDNESLIRKCAFALGDINTPESWETIKGLLQSDNDVIRKVAIEQLNREDKI